MTKTPLTEIICATYPLSVALLGQVLCNNHCQHQGSQVCGADHSSGWWNELFKPALRLSSLLGIFNICVRWHRQKYIFLEKRPPFSSSSSHLTWWQIFMVLGDRDVVQPSPCHRQVIELLIQLWNACIFHMEMNEPNHSIPVCLAEPFTCKEQSW